VASRSTENLITIVWTLQGASPPRTLQPLELMLVAKRAQPFWDNNMHKSRNLSVDPARSSSLEVARNN